MKLIQEENARGRVAEREPRLCRNVWATSNVTGGVLHLRANRPGD
jgi:hypothetical protein